MNDQNAQEPKKCQMCMESTAVKYVCTECEFLCAKCNSNVHSKSKIFLGHKIIPIQEYGSDHIFLMQGAKLKQIFCKKHKEETYCLFCKDCSVPICATCTIECHKRDHDLCKISEIHQEQFRKYSDLKEQNHSSIISCKQEEGRLRKNVSTRHEHYKTTRENVEKKQKQIVDQIQKHFNELLNKCDLQWTEIDTTTNAEIDKIKIKTQELENQKEHIERLLQPHGGLEILTSDIKPVKMHCVANTFFDKHQAMFMPGYVFTVSNAEHLFGKLYNGPSFKLIRSFQSNMKSVSKIISSGANSAIIGSHEDRMIHKVRFDNQGITTDEIIKVSNLFDMALLSDEKILLSVEDHDLKLIGKKGEIESFYSFSPFSTFGVHVTNINNEPEIFVGVAKYKSPGIIEAGKIVVLDKDGREIKSYQMDNQTGNMLFTCPTRILTCSDRSIYVIDSLERFVNSNYHNSRARIVGITREGKQKWSYNDTYPFKPKDIALTPQGLIVILVKNDRINDAIHIIDQSGTFMGLFPLENINLFDSVCVDFDRNGVLWVGCEHSKNNMFSIGLE